MLDGVQRALESLAWLARRALALATSASAGNVGPNVARFTDLSAYGAGLRDGTVAWVRSLRTFAIFHSSAPALAIDNITVAATSVGGDSRWVRCDYSDSTWRLGITDVYIDPQNSTGRASNEAQGIYSSVPAAPDPILTWEELKRRWGHAQYVKTGDPINMTVTVHVLSNVASSDDLTDLDFIADIDTFVRLVGEAPVVVFAGNLDNPGGYTAQAPTAPLGGTPATIKVGATVWGPLIGKRIRFTATGAVAIILKDLGGGVARISPPVVTNEAGFAVHPTLVNPAQGAAFVVEDLTQIAVSDDWAVEFEGTKLGYFQQLNVLDLRVIEAGASGIHFEGGAPSDGSNNMIIWYQCVLDRPVGLDTNVAYLGCRADGIDSTHPSNGYYYGGAIIPSPTSLYKVSRIQGDSNVIGLGALDYWVTFQNQGVLFTGECTAGSFAVFDAPASLTQNPGGHGVLVGGPPNIIAGLSAVHFRGPNGVYGSGSVGAGIRVAACSRGAYQTVPNIIGAAGELQLADATVGFAFNPVTPGYQPAGGLALTWANLAAPLGAGFGGSAHNLDKDAHFCQTAAT